MSQKFYSEVTLETLNNATTDTDRFLVGDSGTIKYRTGSQLLSDLGVSGLYVPYTGATGNVDLGTHTLSSYNLIVNHSSGSGVAASITKGGNGEALTINKSSGSGNAMSVIGGLTSLVDLTLSSIPNATIDTDRFIVSDSGLIKYRTGAEVLLDIGGQAALTNPITGTGTLNYVSKFTGANSLGNSLIFDNGTNVGIGTTTPGNKLSVVTGPAFDDILPALGSNGGKFSLLNAGGLYGLLAGVLGNGNSYLQTQRVDGTALAYNLLLQPRGGNVGIGNTSPTAIGTNITTLDIKGSVGGGIRSGVLGGSESTFYTIAAGGYLGTISNIPLNFQTNNSVKATILANGNIGIGTTTPSQLLELVGLDNIYNQIRTSGANSTSGIVLVNDARNWVIRNNGLDGDKFQIRDVQANAQRLTIDTAGNVGIGTTVPDTLLHVSSLNSSILRLESTNTALGLDAVVGEIQFEANDASASGVGVKGKIGAYSDVVGGNAIGLRFFTGEAGVATATEKMRISATGNVSIGNTPASYGKLELTNTSFGTQTLSFSTTDGTQNPRALIQYVSASGSQRVNFTSAYSTASAYANWTFETGNVGIGTTVPTYKLQIVGDVYTSTGYTAAGNSYMNSIGNTSTNNNANISLTASGVRASRNIADSNTAFAVTQTHASSTGAIQTWNNSVGEKMRVTQAGNVGINTTAPIHKLSVNGKIGGDVYADSFVEFTATTETIVSADGNVVLGYAQNVVVDNEGSVGVGTIAPEICAAVEIKSTTQGFLPPRMDTRDRDNIDTPVFGLMIFNTDDQVVQVFTNGGGWRTLAWL